jgi:hypothetical protein
MAVWVFKDGESQLIDAEYLDGSLQAGWSVTKEGESHVREEIEQQEDGQNANVGQQEKIDEEKADEEDEEIETLRQQAKDAGLKGWHLMSKETLIEKLNEH